MELVESDIKILAPRTFYGYLTDMSDIRRSGVNKNLYQRVDITIPIFNERKFFLNNFEDITIIFFEDGGFIDDLREDFKIGDYLKIVTTGNRKSKVTNIEENSFLVGNLIQLDYLYGDKIKSKMFFNIFIKPFTQANF